MTKKINKNTSKKKRNSKGKIREKSSRAQRRLLSNNTIEQAIQQIFAEEGDRVISYKQVAYVLGKTTMSQKRQIADTLENMVSFDILDRVAMGRYRLKRHSSNDASKKNILVGVINYHKNKATFTEDGTNLSIQLNDENLGLTLDGDKVSIREINKKKRGSQHNKKLYQIDEILSRSERAYVGTLVGNNPNFLFFTSNQNRLRQDFLIPASNLNGAKAGDKVTVVFQEWIKGQKSPVGNVTASLGKAGTNDAEMHAILAEFDLPIAYPKEVEEAAEKLSGEITAEALKEREDFRKVTTFTIDPRDAKDFDDALSVQAIDDNIYEIGVHIADVSHFVQEGSLIDKEAVQRATSIYLVDRTIPMLPERLSNGLCSLRPNEEKYSYSCIFRLNKADAQVVDYRIKRTVICSDRRFTYEEAQDIIKGAEGDFKAELLLLNDIAQKLRAKRFKDGSISFDREEVRFNLDENGKPLSIYLKKSLEAHQLVEEFMLLANKTVAEHIAKDKANPKTFVYRIHDRPNEEKIENFSNFIARMGYKVNVKGSDKDLSKSMNKLFKEIADTPQSNLILLIAVRTMSKAKYTTDNIGHYGLGFPHYAHFTSPIRRYPDLMVHRLLSKYLFEQKPSQDAEYYETLCQHASDMENLATQAERASIKHKQVELLLDYVGQEFDGIISSLSDFGIYVEINENKCEGMIPLRTLNDDYYHYIEEDYAVVGEKSHRRYALGDKVRIVVDSVNLAQRTIDFRFV